MGTTAGRILIPPLTSALVALGGLGWSPLAQADEPPTFCVNRVGGGFDPVRAEQSTPERRREAVWALGCFGPEARRAVPFLVEAIRRGPVIKYEAMSALAHIGEESQLLVSPLIEQFLKEGPPGAAWERPWLFHSPAM